MIPIPGLVNVQAWLVANGLKLAIAVGILLTVSVGSYMKGRSDLESKYASRELKRYEKALEVQAREAKVEAAEAAQAARSKQELETDLNEALGELHDAIDAIPDNPNCALSNDELHYFRELQGNKR